MAKGNMNLSLVDSIKMLGAILGGYFAYKILLIILLIVFGAIANVVSSGAITVPTVINNSINATINSLATAVNTFGTADAFILSLITLVVVFMVFKPWVSSGGKGKKMFN